IGPGQLEWLDRLDREQANLREAMEFSLSEPDGAGAALRLAAGMREFWVARGLIREGRYWFGRALNVEGGRPDERVAALCDSAVLASMQGDITSATESVGRARVLADSAGGGQQQALADLAGGLSALFAGEVPQAAVHLERALPVFEAAGNVLRQVATLLGLAIACSLRDETGRAMEYEEQALTLTEERGESVYRSYSLSMMGLAAADKGDRARAIGLISQGLRLARMIDDTLETSSALATLAWLSAEEQQAERAATLMGAAASVAEAAGGPTVIRDLFGHHHRAQQYAGRALGKNRFDAAVQRGHRFDVDEAVAFALEERATEPVPQQEARKEATPSPLTKREQQVAELVAQGMTNRAIADKLVLSPRTVEWHVEHILGKLNFTTRTQIVTWTIGRKDSTT
ncbi:helix-turn-helix transcriptional regulator, partial [Speluncibacter jeojiensis]|nr:helix-turn-helix transcriptional regulator [Corynebacteriales bacterium D3-21]